MKKIEAIIKPFLLENVKDGLQELGIVGITVSEIKNFRPAPAVVIASPSLASNGADRTDYGTTPGVGGTSPEESFGTEFSPRLKLEVVVTAIDVPAAWECIRTTGKIANEFGDELLVQSLSDVVRIRTDEHGEAAI